ncbi:hypothetical protein WA538_001310, partial [Blastocystis sp. DL]
MRRMRGDGGEGGHNGDHKDDGDEDGHSHKEGDKDNGYEDDGDHKDGHSHKEGDKNNGHKSNEDGHSHNGHKDGHMNGPVDGLKEGLIKNPLITPIKNPLITPIKNPLITPIKNPLITPINTPLNSPNKAIIDLLDLLADLPAISPLRAFLHNPVSLPTLFPPSFPPLPLAAGNLPVLLLLRFLLEFDPNSVISLQPLLPALPANSDTLPDFARNRPFFRLCREYPLLPLFLHQLLLSSPPQFAALSERLQKWALFSLQEETPDETALRWLPEVLRRFTSHVSPAGMQQVVTRLLQLDSRGEMFGAVMGLLRGSEGGEAMRLQYALQGLEGKTTRVDAVETVLELLSAKKDVISEQLESVLERLFGLLAGETDEETPVLKMRILQVVRQMANFPLKKVFGLTGMVARGLEPLLDDEQRVIREYAAKTRNLW